MGIDAEAPPRRESRTSSIQFDHLYMVTGLSSSNLEKLAQESPRSDFEEAIAATTFGKFNLVMLLCALPAFWSAVSITAAPSYIFTRAKCHMNLSLLDMGTVSAMTYAGMISSALLWGFLSDTLGRRKIMVWGFFSAGLVECLGGLSQNFSMILVMRFASGFLFNGPFAVLLAYLAEMHRKEVRAKVMLLTSLFYTIASISLPLLAWAILTHDVDFYIWGNTFVIHSWNLFLLATAMTPLLSGLAFYWLPESPKFLMSRGRNEEAMIEFKKIFAINTGLPADDFPIKTLVQEKSEEQSKGVAALRGGVSQLLPLFRPPHLQWLLLICTIHVGAMCGSNTIRLWYPQLLAMIGSSQSLCAAIAPLEVTVSPIEEECVPIETDMMMYLQSAAVGAGSILTYAIGGVIVNRCGKKVVSGICAILSAVIILLLPYFGSTSSSVVLMVTSALAFTSLLSASLSTIAVELFPTSLRVMAMATFLMAGRMGTIAGTVIFPALMNYGCLPPFITIAAVLGACGFACFFVPNTTLKKLE